MVEQTVRPRVRGRAVAILPSGARVMLGSRGGGHVPDIVVRIVLLEQLDQTLRRR